MLKTKTNLGTDKKQDTRSNAATAGNLNIRRLAEKKLVNNHIAEHHLHTNHKTDWYSLEFFTYSTDH